MANLGNLLVNVNAITEGMPLEGTLIRVSDNGGNSVFEELITDNSGKSPVISLPCPPREFSMEPNAVRKPFAEYNLEIMRSDFLSKRITGIEVFEGTTAIQNVALTPRNGWDAPPETIVIQPHTLYSDFPQKLPEEETKPLPPPTGDIVLDKPVIPETIIVHAGAPTNTSAPNYYVPFKDYIKNVACCEIYSTWPAATIRANVLAILSLTLNRVFTEWYRGQGKNFTITNSTAYDQAFSYGRNIFREISVIVDEMFTTYITKPNIRQPLFTQYCDGRNVQRANWLSQWGSKELGDRGYDHFSILRNYYGNNIYLDTAGKVSGIPSSFPGYNLRVGSRGEAVRTIQNQLNAISKNFPAIPRLVEDGVFGNNTLAAVKTFQKTFDLTQDGIVGLGTWYKISAIYVAVMKMA